MKATIGGWVIILVPILLGILYGLKSYKNELVTEWILTFSTVGAVICLLVGIHFYAELRGGHFSFALLSCLGFAVSALVWEQAFKIFGGAITRYRSRYR